jgi:hypothetical protein
MMKAPAATVESPFASLLLAAGAPITYVSAQLGHANPATTLRYYARWIPGHGRRWVDLLDLDRPTAILEPEMEPKRGVTRVDDPEVFKKVGSPGWARTSDILINSSPQEDTHQDQDDSRPQESKD